MINSWIAKQQLRKYCLYPACHPSIEMMRNVMETGKLLTDETPQWPDDETEPVKEYRLH